MSQTAESLWPKSLGAKTNTIKSLPPPVKILQEQRDTLNEQTRGVLYAEVTRSSYPLLRGTVAHDFYVCVTNKPVRHKLLTIICPSLLGYPVQIENTEAGTTTQVSDEQAFREYLRLIFNAPATREVLGRLLSFAKEDPI